MILTNNGFIMQKYDTNIYQGIEGDNWYLNYLSSSSMFEDYHDSNIDLSWNDNRYLECCTDFNYIKTYIEESKKLNIKYRILLCETEKPLPTINKIQGMESYVLGYDYAYPGGSYYSCVLNDIVSGRIPELKNYKLNNVGLFDTEKEVTQFGEYRKELLKVYNDNFFEKGDFIIYKISEIKNIQEF